jgi:two-component system cell cycle response regulator
MTARILVVDDIPANLRLLEARLVAEYFDVVTATSGPDALALCQEGRIDLVLLDVMMPGMDGFDVCKRLKADQATQHIPVVMITALDQVSDRIRGLEAGADDFLTKPANDLQLMTRVKSLLRLKGLTDELRLRSVTTNAIGLTELVPTPLPDLQRIARILLIDEQESSYKRLMTVLGQSCSVDLSTDPQEALFQAAGYEYECIIVVAGFRDFDPLRLCAQLRSFDRTRLIPIILVAEPQNQPLIIRALELGVNDFITRPVDQGELTARLRTQIKRKRYNDGLRSSVSQTIEMAITDPLTGLHNRRYLDGHLQTLLQRAQTRNKPLSVLITDLDRFKEVNDRYGHDGGDEVLREFASRLRRNVRGIDLACRYGGEEFVVVMPETEHAVAEVVAERLRRDIADRPFRLGRDEPAVDITISVGVTAARADDTVATLFRRADQALYDAKANGRNRVVAAAAA